MKAFSDEMAKYGQAYSFMTADRDSSDILHPQNCLPYPRSGEIKGWLLRVFQSNQGFELGTFNASILAPAMKKQCSKWTDISMGFVSDVIVMVHD